MKIAATDNVSDVPIHGQQSDRILHYLFPLFPGRELHVLSSTEHYSCPTIPQEVTSRSPFTD